jgi:WD40 repeat protein
MGCCCCVCCLSWSVTWLEHLLHVVVRACVLQVVRLWDARSLLAPLAAEQAHTGRVTAVQFSQDGKELVSAGEDGALVTWAVVC